MAEQDNFSRKEFNSLLDELNKIDFTPSTEPAENNRIHQNSLPDTPDSLFSSAAPVQQSDDSIFTPFVQSQPSIRQSSSEQAAAQVQAHLKATSASNVSATVPSSDTIFDENPLISEDFRNFFTQTVTPKALLSDADSVSRPRRKSALLSSLRFSRIREFFFGTDDEDDDEPEQEQNQPESFSDELSGLTAHEDTKPSEPEPDKPSGPSIDTLFEGFNLPGKKSQAPVADSSDGQTQVFVPITGQAAQAAGSSLGETEIQTLCSDTVIFSSEDAVTSSKVDLFSEETALQEPISRPEADEPEQDVFATTQQDLPIDRPVTAPDSQQSQLQNDETVDASAADEADSSREIEQISSSEAPGIPPQSGAEDLFSANQEETDGDAADRQQVADRLSHELHSWNIRCVALGILCLVSFGLMVSASFPHLAQFSGLFSALPAGFVTLFLYLIFLLVGCGVGLPIIQNGLHTFIDSDSPDGFTLLSCCGALIQNLALFAQAESFDGAAQPVLTVFALISLLANALGKRSLADGIKTKNLQLERNISDYRVAGLLHRPTLVNQLSHGLEENDPWLLVSRSADYYDGMMQQTDASLLQSSTTRKLCFGLVASGLIAGLLGGIFHHDFFSPLCYTLTVACPLTSILVSSVPTFFMNKRAAAVDCILPNSHALEELEQANIITTTADQLFPAGSIRLKGMKIYHNARVDLAILYAASLLVPNCATLRHLFLDIIQDRTDILYPSEDMAEEPCCGYCGTVDGKQLLVGSRAMMLSHEITIPQLDYEQRYTKDGKYDPVYLSVDGQLYAMFIVHYRADRDVKAQLDEIYDMGLSLLVSGDDFILNSEKIEAVYGIPSGCIKVLGAADTQLLNSLSDHCDHCDGCLLHRNPFHGLVAGIRIAAAGIAMERAAFLIQTVFSILSAVLILIFSCLGSLSSFTPFALLLYQLVWVGLTLLLPVAKKY